MAYYIFSMKYTLILFAFSSIFFACQKKGEPEALICFSKKSYVLSDTIRVENCSKKYTKQRWVLPDGTQSTGDYAYFIPTTSGTFKFTLYVSNDKFVNEFEASQNVEVKP